MVLSITQEQHINTIDNNIRAEHLIRQTKVLNIARLAKMLVNLFGLDAQFEKVPKKFEGKEIEMHLKELDGYITFIMTSDRGKFECRVEKASKPIAKIIIMVKEKEILKVISEIIRSKANLFGIMKLLKFIIPGKAKIKGDLRASLKLVKCLMIGKNDVYKKRK
ncbi:MAG: hypothetical protein ACFFBH_15385 [Promethearchaeota archaeon]